MGTTKKNNLVLKYFRNFGATVYPASNSWIILDEARSVGTPALVSHDNKTLSIVVRTLDGTLLHKQYTVATDFQQDGPKFPSQVFVSNPALILRPDSTLIAFANDANGTMHRATWSTQGDWSAWIPTGDNFVGSPTTIVRQPGPYPSVLFFLSRSRSGILLT